MEQIEMYKAALQGARIERDQIDKRRAVLDNAIDALEAVIKGFDDRLPSPLQSTFPRFRPGALQAYINENSTSISEQAENLKYKPTITDLCEIVLRKADQPLHYSVLGKALEKLGRPTSFNTIGGNLPQDALNRFEALGRAVFALREWPEEKKAPFRVKKRNYVRADTVAPDSESVDHLN